MICDSRFEATTAFGDDMTFLARSHCVCLPPFRGSHCDIIDQSKDDEAEQKPAGYGREDLGVGSDT